MEKYDVCGTMPENAILAYAYVPIQKWGNVYPLEQALREGTLFPSLNKPLGVYGRDLCKKCENGEGICCDA